MTYPTQTTPTPMTRLNIYVDAELRRRLEALSAATGAAMGEISRRALVAWIQQQEQARRSA
jgi:hypothetical protein